MSKVYRRILLKLAVSKKRVNKLEKCLLAEKQDSVKSTRPNDTTAASEKPKGVGPNGSVLKTVSGVGTVVRSSDSNLFSRVKAAEPHSGTR